MHSIQIGNITKQYPSSIAEMNSLQFTEFSGLVYKYQTKQIHYYEFMVNLVYALLDMQRRVDVNKHPEIDQITENINAIAKLNEDFFRTKIEKGKSFKIIKTDFVKNLLPKVNVGKEMYYGPSDALVNTEFGEYVTALNAYIDYSQSGEVSDLDTLVGTLYRPERKKGKTSRLQDRRIEFDKNSVSYYAEKVSIIPFEEKYAIYLFFSACQHFIVTSKELPISGGITINLSVLFNQNSSTTEKGIGMAGVIYSLAESNVFGDAEKTAKQNTYDVLLRMIQTYLQAKKLKSNAKN